MFTLHTRNNHMQCGVIVDIGSGSVGVAIIVSESTKPKPNIIWSHREYVVIKEIDSTNVPLKEITTSLINAFLHLGNEGQKALYSFDKNLKIETLQATVSAPWVYTVTKTINFTDEHPFTVDQHLIDELSGTAEKQAFATVLENNIFKENQLEIIDNITINTTINGYTMPSHQSHDIKTREVSLAHITAITQKKIVSVLQDSQNKILPKVQGETHSFMYMFYDVLRHMNPDTSEACLVDITSEATEIGIIREGTLSHVTHVSFGTFSIAREIAHSCLIPKEEAYTYIKGGTQFIEEKLSEQQKEDLSHTINAYEEKVANLFKVTGDALSIPKTIFLHCELATEPFFIKCIENASKKATTMQHNIHPITHLFFQEDSSADTALLLSAQYFHRTHTDTQST